MQSYQFSIIRNIKQHVEVLWKKVYYIYIKKKQADLFMNKCGLEIYVHCLQYLYWSVHSIAMIYGSQNVNNMTDR